MNIPSFSPTNISFASKKQRQEQKAKRNIFLVKKLTNQLSQAKTGISMVDFCTCNRWDWMIHGLSAIKTDKRHKRKAGHFLSLRLISPVEDSTCWVNLEINKRGSIKSPPKKLLIINAWLEKTPEGFKLHRVNEEKRLALETEINKFGRETHVSQTGEILIDPKAVRNQNQSKHWAKPIPLEEQPKLIDSIARLLQQIGKVVLPLDKLIADNPKQRKEELAQFFDIKA